MKRKKECTCQTCGVSFIPKSHVMVLKYCSRVCMKGNKEWLEKQKTKQLGIKAWNRGKPNTWSNGVKSNFWKDGDAIKRRGERRTFMNSLEYVNWRRNVFERDKYTCQICETTGGELRANHIKKYADYKDLRIDLKNGITICKSCDLRWVLNREEQWESYFNFNLETRRNEIWL